MEENKDAAKPDADATIDNLKKKIGNQGTVSGSKKMTAAVRQYLETKLSRARLRNS